MIRHDTGCYFNVRSKADRSQLNLPHGDYFVEQYDRIFEVVSLQDYFIIPPVKYSNAGDNIKAPMLLY